MRADNERFFMIVLRGSECDASAGCCLSGDSQIGIGSDDLTLSCDRATYSKHTDTRTLCIYTFPEAARSTVVEVGHLDYCSAPAADTLCSKPFCARKSHDRGRRG